MTDEQNVAFIISQSVGAMVKAMGMQAENKQREISGHDLTYKESDFEMIEKDFIIGSNDVTGQLLGR
jgi:hypothetical protein